MSRAVYGSGGCYGITRPHIGEIQRAGRYRLCVVDGKIFDVNEGRLKIGKYYCSAYQITNCAFYPAKIICIFTLIDDITQKQTGVAALLENNHIQVFIGEKYVPIQIICDGILRVGNYYCAEEFKNEIPYNDKLQFKVDGRYIYRYSPQQLIISDIFGNQTKNLRGPIDKWDNGCMIYSYSNYQNQSHPVGEWYFEPLPIIPPSKVFNNFSQSPTAREIADNTEIKIKGEANRIRAEYHETIAQICVDAVVSSAEKLSHKMAIESNLENELAQTKEELKATKDKLEEYVKHLECAICFTETKKRAAYSCGHMNVCQECDSEKIKECPICKVPIMLRFKVIIP